MSTPDTSEFLLISRGQWDESARPDEVQAAIDRFYAWHEDLSARGVFGPGSRLKREGRVVTRHGTVDGPFAEAKELVGGYWTVFASSLDEAARIVAANPCLAYGLSMEIRPLDADRARTDVVANETPRSWPAPGEGEGEACA